MNNPSPDSASALNSLQKRLKWVCKIWSWEKNYWLPTNWGWVGATLPERWVGGNRVSTKNKAALVSAYTDRCLSCTSLSTFMKRGTDISRLTFPDRTFPDWHFPISTYPDGTIPDGTFPDLDISRPGHFPTCCLGELKDDYKMSAKLQCILIHTDWYMLMGEVN